MMDRNILNNLLLKRILFLVLFFSMTFNTLLLGIEVVSAEDGGTLETQEVTEGESSESVEEISETIEDEIEETEKVEEADVDSVEIETEMEDFEIQEVPLTLDPIGGEEDYEGKTLELQISISYPYGVITYPVTDYDVESGSIDLLAEYYDGDDVNEDAVQWAVRFDTCSANTNTVFGNVDGHNDSFTWDGEDFSANIDLDTLEPGNYCFIFNPTDDGEVDVRETRWFTVEEEEVFQNACELETIYGVNDGSDLNIIDPDTGDVSFVADLEFGSWAVTVDPDTGRVYYLSTNGNSLGIYDPETESSSSIDITGDSIGDVSRLAFHPENGLMYVGDQDLKLFTLSVGGVSDLLGTISGISTGGGDIAFGPDGTLYLTGHDSLLFEVDYSGSPIASLLGPTGLSRPSGLAWRDDGLYVSNMSDNDNKVQIYSINLDDLGNPVVVGDIESVRNQDLGSCVQYEEPEEPQLYGNYCGDGEVNQEWEQCDGGYIGEGEGYVEGGQCNAQCQFVEQNMCTDLVLAQVVSLEERVLNQGNGDMTSDVYIGQSESPIPDGAWFPLYWMGSFFTDPDVNGAEGYEDVPGYAVERQQGSVRVVMHGAQTAEDDEFAQGYLNFWNVSPTAQREDTEGDNVLENPFNGSYNEPFTDGNDELDLEEGLSKFVIKSSTGSDGFYTDYSDAPICEPVVDDNDSVPTEDEDSDSNPAENGDGRRVISSGGSASGNSGGGQVLGASTESCSLYLTDYMKIGSTNVEQVTKLQTFLNGQGIPVPVTGVFESLTESAVRTFQSKYKVEVLDPWAQIGLGDGLPTGYVFKTTRWKINDIVCPGIEAFPILP